MSGYKTVPVETIMRAIDALELYASNTLAGTHSAHELRKALLSAPAMQVVPMEPTAEMVEAAEDAYMPFGDMDLAIRMALLTAPAAQGEPEVHTYYVLHDATGGQNYIKKDADDGCLAIFEEEEDAQRAKRRHPGTEYKRVDYYTAPQTAEQRPLDPSLAFDASVHLTNWLNMDWCECEGAHTCGYNEVKRTRDALLAAAEQHYVPDVQGEPVAFCEDAALSLAERTFSTEVDEQLASDITQYARRLHTLYTATQPAEQKSRSDALLVEQTEKIAALLAKAFQGSQLTEGVTFRDCENPKAKQCWDVACRIQEELTATDVENALAELEDDQKPISQAWDGEGVPPIGTVCEYRWVGDDWRRCEIVGHYFGSVVGVDVVDASALRFPVDLLRPIKTPEQQPAPDVSALVEALEDISVTGPNEGTAWLHETAYKALAAHRKGGDA